MPTRIHSKGDTENSSTLGDKVGRLLNERLLKQREAQCFIYAPYTPYLSGASRGILEGMTLSASG